MKPGTSLMILLLLWMGGVGCSSTYQFSSSAFRDMNSQLSGADATIILNDGTERHVRDIQLLRDSVSWTNPQTGKRLAESNSQLSRIVLVKTNHLLGALEGAGICLLAGGLMGLVATPSHERDYAVLYSILYGGIGAGAGLLMGAIIGHSDYFEFRFSQEDGPVPAE